MKKDVELEIREAVRKDLCDELIEHVTLDDLVKDIIWKNSELSDRTNGHKQFEIVYRHAGMYSGKRNVIALYERFVQLEDMALELLENCIDKKDLGEQTLPEVN